MPPNWKHGDLVVSVTEEFDELEHRLAGQNDFLPLAGLADRLCRVRKPMAVGRHRLELPVLDDEQHAVEVVANVLLGHRVLDEQEEGAQPGLRQPVGGRAGRFREPRKVLRRERLQAEAALARLHLDLVRLRIQSDGGVFGQRAQDVHELAGRNRHLLVAGRLVGERELRSHLDFQVGGDELELLSRTLDQHVREDGQRVPSLHDPGHGLQRAEDFVAFGFQHFHIGFIKLIVVSGPRPCA
jgi:hypothetical protein